MGNFFKDLGNTFVEAIKAPTIPIQRAVETKGRSLYDPRMVLKTTEQVLSGNLRAVNRGAVVLNPLNSTLKKVSAEAYRNDRTGYIGNLSEWARKNPVTTTASVYVAGGVAGYYGVGSSAGIGAAASSAVSGTAAIAAKVGVTALVGAGSGALNNALNKDKGNDAKNPNENADITEMSMGGNIALFLGLGAIVGLGYMMYKKGQ